jgi:hypothetical protein
MKSRAKLADIGMQAGHAGRLWALLAEIVPGGPMRKNVPTAGAGIFTLSLIKKEDASSHGLFKNRLETVNGSKKTRNNL